MGALHFPEGFLWGTATSGHQIEGWNDSSDWWEWEQRGHIHDGTRSGRAMEYWDRYESDHELMAQLGYPAFRLGVEWARIEPTRGRIDGRALNHYRKILTSLRAHGIRICLTLNHWVLPHWVVQQHDWMNPKTIEDFLAYAGIVIEALGEFPDYWVTFNEPMVPAIAGNLFTRHPPQRGSWRAFRAVTNAHLEAHARVYHLIHQRVPRAPDGDATRVGVAKAYPWIEAWGSSGCGRALRAGGRQGSTPHRLRSLGPVGVDGEKTHPPGWRCRAGPSRELRLLRDQLLPSHVLEA